MSAFRIALLAEGSAEVGGERQPYQARLPAAGTDLVNAELGPAHLLVRNAVVRARGIPENGVRFVEPQHVSTGGRARGSQLLDLGVLRRLVYWPPNQRRPDLTVVLVDEDEEGARHRALVVALDDVPVPHVVAVAVREFESWLIADRTILRQVGGEACTPDGPIEALPRRRAKELLAAWCTDRQLESRVARMDIASGCDLDEVARQCPSFGEFLKGLAAS